MWAEDWHPWADHDPRYGPAGRYRPFARAPPPYARRVHPVIPPPPPQRFFPPGPPRFYPPMILPPRLPELTTPHAGGDMREQPRDNSREIPTVQLWSDFDEPVKPQVIKFGVDTSAIRCVVSWKLPDLQAYTKIKQRIEISDNLRVLETEELLPHINSHRIKTVPGNQYTVRLTISDHNDKVLATGSTEFKATFSHEEIEKLHARAVDFTGNILYPFRYLYRCKPKCYWDDIHFRTQGVMEVYIKDNNGQAASPINGEIHGLFFSAKLAPDGTLPNTSPFGDVRMILPAMSLLDPARINMYFADFYCNRVTHYVTIVITQRGSKTDRFCKEKLRPLNHETNHFLRVIHDPKTQYLEFFVNRNVWVEIYYTENIPLHWGAFDTIMPVGAGTSKIGGLPHNKACTSCNLYLTGKSAEEVKPASKVCDNEPPLNGNSTLDLLMELESRRTGHAPSGELLEVLETLVSAVDQTVYSIEDEELLAHRLLIENQVLPLNVDEAKKKLDELDTYEDTKNLISKICQDNRWATSPSWYEKSQSPPWHVKKTKASKQESSKKENKRKSSQKLPDDEYLSDDDSEKEDSDTNRPSTSSPNISLHEKPTTRTSEDLDMGTKDFDLRRSKPSSTWRKEAPPAKVSRHENVAPDRRGIQITELQHRYETNSWRKSRENDQRYEKAIVRYEKAIVRKEGRDF
uniref:Phytanoyl-CoA hydroxylase-interacting protein-like C-terminal domain-containing protein n=1 Tax=Acrobeloides nanus TaxID=290746 RepID=A0A914CGC7_9BILA